MLNLGCLLDIQVEMLSGKMNRVQDQVWAKRHRSGTHQFLDRTQKL